MQCSFKSFSLISLFFVAFTGLFISCSQVTPEIYTTDYSVIFDYRDEEALPSARLSVFASSASDVRRYERISIKSLDSGYIWDTRKIERLDTYDLQWVGCTNLIVPEEEKLKDLRIIMEHYHIGKFDFDKSVLPKVTVYKLVVENMTGKRRNHARQV